MKNHLGSGDLPSAARRVLESLQVPLLASHASPVENLQDIKSFQENGNQWYVNHNRSRFSFLIQQGVEFTAN